MGLARVEGVASDRLSKGYHDLPRERQIALRKLVNRLAAVDAAVEREVRLSPDDIRLLRLLRGEAKP